MSKTKTYWKGYSEKNNTPEFLESSHKEFQEKIPVEEFLADDGVQDLKTGRRDFLKFMGFSIAAASLASCEAPIIKSIPYVNKPEEITPGVANWYSSSFYDGNHFANILVKSREGRPIWLKGKKDGFTKGGITPIISTSILNLYNSARLNGPLKNNKETNWVSVDEDIKKELDKITNENGTIRILSNTIISPSTKKAIDEFISAYTTNDDQGNAISDIKHIQYDARSYYGIRLANEKTFGQAFIPSYNFQNAKSIVSVNADFIGSWLLPSKFSCDYSKTRKPENGWMSKHFQFESNYSLTGANADYRAQIKPSQEGAFVSSLLSMLEGGNPTHDFSQDVLTKLSNAVVSLNQNKGASLVVSSSNDSHVQAMVNKINFKLGNYGSTINHTQPLNLFDGNDTEVEQLVNDISANKIDALIVYNCNPVYSLPNGDKFGEALTNSKMLKVSFADVIDETAACCQYVCPDHNYLESWCDFEPIPGHVSLQQPIIRPLYNTRQAQESFLVWAKRANRGVNESKVFYNFIKENWAANNIGNQSDYITFDEFWNWTVHNGFTNTASINSIELEDFEVNTNVEVSSSEWEVALYQNELGLGQYASNPWLQELPSAITKVVWDNYITMSPSDCFKLFGINDENPKAAWDGVHLGQEDKAFVATVKAGDNALTLPVFPLPGQTQGTIGVAMGYGRGVGDLEIGKAAFQCDEFGNHLNDENGALIPVGGNAFKLSSFSNGLLNYQGAVEVIATNEKYSLACTQTHHTIMGRTSIIKETTYDFWKKNHEHNQEAYNPVVKLHSHAEGGHSEVNATEYSLWEEHPVEIVGHRWGMSIDLSSCNGCGVCITACHSENNVPVVGKDEVRRSRDMHWLRMDRYFSSIEDDNRSEWEESRHVDGDFDYGKLEVPEDNPSVVFMPMLCQHCNHAPCETVCPVAATTHSNEGLNMMTYNRCIGTRYCANNCPYKVRRFNWFNYRDYRKFKNVNPNQDMMARMVLNPDVVVRSRGVMEKCSFCVQGIQAAKLKAKKEGRKLVDGDVNCACGDACPNDCITFGDWNDESSKIREVSGSDRSYQALEEVGVKPNIWYQLKIRNNNDEIAANEVSAETHISSHQ